MIALTFTCGHHGPALRNMGRGAARNRRLIEYYDRPCKQCAIQLAIAQAKLLTTVRAAPLTGDALTQAIDRYVARTESRYQP